MTDRFDFIILGSGFGGSLLSMILAKSGRTVCCIDRSEHPRFAIGESSTPLAGRLMAQIAQTAGLPELMPLTRYGTWVQQLPHVMRGRKRGFSYFGHQSGKRLSSENQMLVSASRSDTLADTHWLRSDVDRFLHESAAARGVIQYENSQYALQSADSNWTVTGTSKRDMFHVSAPFLVDATGRSGEVLNYLRIPDHSDSLRTESCAVFAHFADVPSVASMLQAEAMRSHPFDCDAAAVHHVLEQGWMWQLRFDDDSVSAGFVGRFESRDCAQDVWQSMLSLYPSLHEQFAVARIVRPDHGLTLSGRLQRLRAVAAGKNWAAIPSTVGFVDPLHSTGIAHNLSGIARLSTILLSPDEASVTQNLAEYSDSVVSELRLIDQLVEGCYASQPVFRLWCAWCMLYFAAVTSMEQQSLAGTGSFLHARDSQFREVVLQARQRLQRAVESGGDAECCTEFEEWLQDAIAPWNHVGLLDPECHGMYSATAAPVY